MKMLSRSLAALFILVFLFSPALSPAADMERQDVSQNESKKKEDPYKKLPPIGGLTVRQMGSDTLVAELTGTSLPRPEVLSVAPDKVVFSVPGAYLAAKKWERGLDLPLAVRVAAVQEEANVVFTLFVTENLTLKTMSGMSPANKYILRFTTANFEARDQVAKTVASEVAPKAAPVPGDPFMKTVPVTLDLRDVELRDVFRMLGEYANMNIVTDPSIPNTLVTMTLRGVPLNEAMNYLMRMYGVTYALMGRTIIVGTADNLGKSLGKESMREYRIAYADMKSVGGLLQGLTGVTNVVADERLRTLYVTGRAEQLVEVEKILQRLDHPGRQVMLQARIVEVTDSAKDELETIIDAVYNRWWLNYSSAGLGTGYVYADNPAAYTPQTGDSRLPPLAPFTKGGLVNIASESLTRLLDVGLKALVTKNKGKVLADPSVIMLDGRKATIKLVENYPYISERDDAGNPTWQEKEVGPRLEVTPFIGRDGMVTLDLKISTGEIIGTYRGQAGEQFPQTTNREVNTSIRVRDGEPFVVGGLYKDQKKSETHRIPILGDIPLLGLLFQFKSNTRDKTEVAMIVIPYILDIPDTVVEKTILR